MHLHLPKCQYSAIKSDFILLLCWKWQKECRYSSIRLIWVLEWRWRLCQQTGEATWHSRFNAIVRQLVPCLPLTKQFSLTCLDSSPTVQIFVTKVSYSFLTGEISAKYLTGNTRYFLWEVDAEKRWQCKKFLGRRGDTCESKKGEEAGLSRRSLRTAVLICLLWKERGDGAGSRGESLGPLCPSDGLCQANRELQSEDSC